jgi:hypothetical protein
VAKQPGEGERVEATRRLLAGLIAGDDAHDISRAVWDLHAKDNTFPGEVFLRLGLASLDLAGTSSERPVGYEGLVSKFLPECQFRGATTPSSSSPSWLLRLFMAVSKPTFSGRWSGGVPTTSGSTSFLLPLPWSALAPSAKA